MERRPQLTVVVGAKWGDEGKGKITDALVRRGVTLVGQGQGGPNAGHVIIEDNGTPYDLHGLPAGILNDQVDNFLGHGVVVNPDRLIEQLDTLRNKGKNSERLMISDRAHLILPYNPIIDGIEEAGKGTRQVGTTKQGIGPTYADKASRVGLQAELLRDPDVLLARIQEILIHKRRLFELYSNKALPDELRMDFYDDKVQKWHRELSHYLGDTDKLVERHFINGGSILLEGNQGFYLNLNSRDYPYVTSSDTSVSGVLAGSGISASYILDCDFEAIGVQKAIDTRVGEGPFPTEMSPERAALFQDDTEKGATTGRTRKIGDFDGVAARGSQRGNRFTKIAVTKLDFLAGKGPIKIADAYKLRGRVIYDGPTNSRDLALCTPRYVREYEFSTDISGVRSLKDLPELERKYVYDILSFYPGAELFCIGVGRRSSEIIYA